MFVSHLSENSAVTAVKKKHLEFILVNTRTLKEGLADFIKSVLNHRLINWAESRLVQSSDAIYFS